MVTVFWQTRCLTDPKQDHTCVLRIHAMSFPHHLSPHFGHNRRLAQQRRQNLRPCRSFQSCSPTIRIAEIVNIHQTSYISSDLHPLIPSIIPENRYQVIVTSHTKYSILTAYCTRVKFFLASHAEDFFDAFRVISGVLVWNPFMYESYSSTSILRTQHPL